MHPDPYTSQDVVSRHVKSATALIALRRTLDGEPWTGAARFCDEYDWLRARPTGHFDTVWRDPTAYLWARVAYELLAVRRGALAPSDFLESYRTHLGAANVADALDQHLAQFGRYLLAAAVLGGEPLAFARPLLLSPPAALPGLGLTLTGPEVLAVTGFSGDAIELAGGERLAPEHGASAGDCTVIRDPVAVVGNGRVRLQPAAYHWPGLVAPAGLADLPPEFQERHRPLLEAALQCIGRYQPSVFATMERELQVVAFKPRDAGGYGNVTHSDLPGACVVSVLDHPFEMGDALIHEFHHHRLFVLEEDGRFFDETRQDPHGECRYYSPWRTDPRPLHGLLHALYVFLPVRDYWQAVEADQGLEPALRTYARSQWTMLDGQLRATAATLRRHARWSAHGGALMDELERKLGDVPVDAGDVPALYCSPDGQFKPFIDPDSGAPVSVAAQLRLHAERYAHQHPDLVS